MLMGAIRLQRDEPSDEHLCWATDIAHDLFMVIAIGLACWVTDQDYWSGKNHSHLVRYATYTSNDRLKQWHIFWYRVLVVMYILAVSLVGKTLTESFGSYIHDPKSPVQKYPGEVDCHASFLSKPRPFSPLTPSL